MRKLLFGTSTSLLVSCGASIKSSFKEQLKPFAVENKVAFLHLENKVPENLMKTRVENFGDTGFSIDCDSNTLLIKARNLARKNDANIVKVTEKREPHILGSSFYNMYVDFYFNDRALTKLSQYQIQIN